MTKTKKDAVKAEASETSSLKTRPALAIDTDETGEGAEIGKKGSGGQTPVKLQERKPSSELAPALSADDRQVLRRLGAKMLTGTQINGSVSISCPDNKAIDLALKHGAQGLVDEFAPADAIESTLAPVIVGIRNAVMASLHLATGGSSERRDIELNTALKGAGVLGQLLEAFDAHRGHGGRRFTVGNVNVESGAQAIVAGNVETTPPQAPRAKASTVEPNKRKPRVP